jgi:hypothetical protein
LGRGAPPLSGLACVMHMKEGRRRPRVEEGVMKAVVNTRKRRLAPLVRVVRVFTVTAAVCLMTAGIASAIPGYHESLARQGPQVTPVDRGQGPAGNADTSGAAGTKSSQVGRALAPAPLIIYRDSKFEQAQPVKVAAHAPADRGQGLTTITTSNEAAVAGVIGLVLAVVAAAICALVAIGLLRGRRQPLVAAAPMTASSTASASREHRKAA